MFQSLILLLFAETYFTYRTLVDISYLMNLFTSIFLKSSDFDECSSAPCVNGGRCEDKINSYICRCAEGYFGVNCQTGTVLKDILFNFISIV